MKAPTAIRVDERAHSALSLVKMISGITAKESCRLSTTWLNTSRLPVLLSPKNTIVMSAGTSARRRVTSRRNQAGSRM